MQRKAMHTDRVQIFTRFVSFITSGQLALKGRATKPSITMYDINHVYV